MRTWPFTLGASACSSVMEEKPRCGPQKLVREQDELTQLRLSIHLPLWRYNDTCHHRCHLLSSFMHSQCISSSLQQARRSSFILHHCHHVENAFGEPTESSRARSSASCPKSPSIRCPEQPSGLLGSKSHDASPMKDPTFPGLRTYPVTGVDCLCPTFFTRSVQPLPLPVLSPRGPEVSHQQNVE
uniref:Uncharacterized protein n=1 Tax=Molossus molossus TaxID=27622 RepID=A0A7J8JXR6_MOLMO|nr:hypothetical protein HJG59_008104 [Molossus molossus]